MAVVGRGGGRGGAVGNILGIKSVLVFSTLILMDNLMDILVK
jgi:hypothetical protein